MNETGEINKTQILGTLGVEEMEKKVWFSFSSLLIIAQEKSQDNTHKDYRDTNLLLK